MTCWKSGMKSTKNWPSKNRLWPASLQGPQGARHGAIRATAAVQAAEKRKGKVTMRMMMEGTGSAGGKYGNEGVPTMLPDMLHAALANINPYASAQA